MVNIFAFVERRIMKMKEYSIFVTCTIGNVREKNEDNFYLDGVYRGIDDEQECIIRRKVNADTSHVIAVFDGMGGEKDGEKASWLSAKTLAEYEKEMAKTNRKHFDFHEVIYNLNDAVCRMGKKRKCTMGSTAVIMRINNEQATICNVGDSRAYIYRNNKLEQLTEDHTVAADNIRMCKNLGIEYINLGKKATNTLTQHLGIEEKEFVLEPAISDKIDMKNGDIYMLCSDGLSHLIDESEICEILKKEISISDKGEVLSELALAAGGTDNITIVLVEVIN